MATQFTRSGEACSPAGGHFMARDQDAGEPPRAITLGKARMRFVEDQIVAG